jgi:LytTr DNA-binding domain-containing protein
MYFVAVADVEWVDSAGNYVRLHAGGRTHLYRETMKAFAQQLDPERFVRIHRSAIVNIDCIAQAVPRGAAAALLAVALLMAPSNTRAQSAALSQGNAAATEHVATGDWVDFLQLAKWNGRWVIVNVLWEMRPAPQAP